jgi:hypothetical protein
MKTLALSLDDLTVETFHTVSASLPFAEHADSGQNHCNTGTCDNRPKR